MQAWISSGIFTDYCRPGFTLAGSRRHRGTAGRTISWSTGIRDSRGITCQSLSVCRTIKSWVPSESVCPTDLEESLRAMARFRNRLVHIYWQVDDGLVVEYLHGHLNDFDRYAMCLARLL